MSLLTPGGAHFTWSSLILPPIINIRAMIWVSPTKVVSMDLAFLSPYKTYNTFLELGKHWLCHHDYGLPVHHLPSFCISGCTRVLGLGNELELYLSDAFDTVHHTVLLDHMNTTIGLSISPCGFSPTLSMTHRDHSLPPVVFVKDWFWAPSCYHLHASPLDVSSADITCPSIAMLMTSSCSTKLPQALLQPRQASAPVLRK